MFDIYGIFSRLEPPNFLVEVLKKSKVISKADIDGDIKSLIECPDNKYFLYEKEHFFWEERSYWPLAYSTLFAQLTNIVKLFEIELQNRNDEFSMFKKQINVEISSEYARNLPTVLHYAMASLGAWVGGSANFQYFSHFATKPQIENNDTNIAYAKQIGYSDVLSKEFTVSGIINIPARLALPLVSAQKNKSMFGSIGVNEFNIANLPAEEIFSEDKYSAEKQYAGFLMDKYYRTVFTARESNNNALYGANSVLRDHYEEFYNSLKDYDLIRCKHYVHPVIEVSTYQEMEDIYQKSPVEEKEGCFFEVKLHSIH
jgi:hypothetical protein